MPGPVWKQPAAQARAAADVMSTSRALDRHPDLPEKSFIQKVYGEPTTRSGVVEGWDAPPPTIVSDDFQAQRAAGLQAMADADRFAAMSNGPPAWFAPVTERVEEEVSWPPIGPQPDPVALSEFDYSRWTAPVTPSG